MADSTWIDREWRTLFQRLQAPGARRPKQSDIAQQILANVRVDYKATGSAGSKKGPSVVSRILDILSRPSYAKNEALKRGMQMVVKNAAKSRGEGLFGVGYDLSDQAGAAASGVLAGFTGKKKTSGHDLPIVGSNAALAFGFDIATDPLNALPVGVPKKAVDLLKGLGKLSKTAEAVKVSDTIAQGARETAPASMPRSANKIEVPEEKIEHKVTATNPRTYEAEEFVITERELNDHITGTKVSPKLTKHAPEDVEIDGQYLDEIFVEKTRDLGKTPSATLRGLDEGDPEAIADLMPKKGNPAGAEATLTPKELNLQQRNIGTMAADVLKNERGAAHAFNDAKMHKQFNQVLSYVEKIPEFRANPVAARRRALLIYEGIERGVQEATGIAPKHSKTGLDFSLAEQLNRASVDNFSKDAMYNATQEEYTLGVLNDAQRVQPAVEAGLDQMAEIATNPLLPQSEKGAVALTKALATTERMSKQIGVGQAGIAAAKEILRAAHQTGDPVVLATQKFQNRIREAVNTGKRTPETIKAEQSIANEAMIKEFEVGMDMVVGTADFTAESIFSRVMAALKPDFRNGDLRQIFNNNLGVRQSVTNNRARQIEQIFRGMSKDEITSVTDYARKGLAFPPQYAEKGQELTKWMDDSSTALRNGGVLPETFGRHLKYKGVSNLDVEGTVEFQDAWRTAAVNPGQERQFLSQWNAAVESSLFEKGTFDDAIQRFGSATPKQGYVHIQSKNPYLNDTFFPKEIASQFPYMLRHLEQMYIRDSDFWKNIDAVQSMWKSGVTIYTPSHHVRNSIGEVFMNSLDGVSNPWYYRRASRIMRANKHMLDEPEMLRSMTEGPKIRVPKNNGKYSDNEIFTIAFQNGLFGHHGAMMDLVPEIGDITKLGRKLQEVRPLGGRVQRVARGTSTYVTNEARMAHLTGLLAKNVPVEQAVRRVRKYHPDGLDLTRFEKKVLRRAIPFYSWMRKAMPLIAEGVLERPAVITAYPKGMQAIAEMMGVETGGIAEPFPTDQLFPDWITDKGIGPVLGGPGSYWIVNPSNPFHDIVGPWTGDPGNQALGMVSPLAKVPAEIASDTRIGFGGAPPSADWSQYITEQFPILNVMNRISDKKLAEGDVGLSGEKLANFLTAAGIINTSKYTKQATYEERERQRAAG